MITYVSSVIWVQHESDDEISNIVDLSQSKFHIWYHSSRGKAHEVQCQMFSFVPARKEAGRREGKGELVMNDV